MENQEKIIINKNNNNINTFDNKDIILENNLLKTKSDYLFNSYDILKVILCPNLTKEKNEFMYMALDMIKAQIIVFIKILYIKDSQKYMTDKFGGGMVLRVANDESVILQGAPEKFEAGTLPLTQISGVAVAIDELEKSRPDLKLIQYMYDELKKISRIKILSSRDAAVLSFVVDGMHVLDFGTLVGANGICLRVGNMCASWIHKMMGIDGSVRVSVGPWNTFADADKFISVVRKIIK